jgi:CBS domain-containing protein
MMIREIMTRNVECTHPDDTLRHAAELMRNLDVGALPVCENDRLVGMITDRDIVIRVVAKGEDAGTTLVVQAMTPEVITCRDDDDVKDVASIMRDQQIRRIVVLSNDTNRIVGVVSLGDLAVESGDENLAGATLEGISEPTFGTAFFED